MDNNINTSNDGLSKSVRYASIDGVNYAVPGYATYIFVCKRGFLHMKGRKPEVVSFKGTRDWTPEKQTLHAPNDRVQMQWPLQLDKNGREDWESLVYSTTDKITNPSLPLVDCTKHKY